MTLITSGVITQLRTTWQGVGGVPYYSGLFVNTDASDVDIEADVLRALWDGLKGIFVNELTATIEDQHPQFNIATGVTVGLGTSNQDPVTGTGGGELLPRATQIYVACHTGEFVNGRELRGGFYIPGIDANLLQEGTIDPTSVTGIQGIVDDVFFDPVTGFLNSALVYSRTHHVAAVITSLKVKGEFAVLRSRRD